MTAGHSTVMATVQFFGWEQAQVQAKTAAAAAATAAATATENGEKKVMLLLLLYLEIGHRRLLILPPNIVFKML